MITISINSNAAEIAEHVRDFRERGIGASIARAMDEQNLLTIERITEARLTGKGPFPPAEHRLGVKTGLLRASLRATPAQISGQKITSAIGTNIKYAGIHEFGGAFKRKTLGGVVRLRTDARGQLMRGSTRGAVFAKKEHQRVAERQFTFKAGVVTFPERAPIRTGIEDCAPLYGAAVSAAIVEAWNKKGEQK